MLMMPDVATAFPNTPRPAVLALLPETPRAKPVAAVDERDAELGEAVPRDAVLEDQPAGGQVGEEAVVGDGADADDPRPDDEDAAHHGGEAARDIEADLRGDAVIERAEGQRGVFGLGHVYLPCE